MSVSVAGIYGSYGLKTSAGVSARQSETQELGRIFLKIDSQGKGVISRQQFLSAFQSMKPSAAFRAVGPDTLYEKLGPDLQGNVTRHSFVQGMANLMAQNRSTGINAF
jgi:Ca2+-binding EF-hand superfamily protein